MAKLLPVLVMLLVALIQSTSPVKATDCVSLVAHILPCASYLGNSLPGLPGTQCCDAATSVVSKADSESLCQCFKQNPLGSRFLASKAQQIPALCNVDSFSPLVNCLALSDDSGSGFPFPVFPFPPLGSLPPFPQIPLPPFGPFPPLPNIPLPPFGPFPPLPNIPLPPIGPLPNIPLPPFGNLPPLPQIPLPPLSPLAPLIPSPPQVAAPQVA